MPTITDTKDKYKIDFGSIHALAQYVTATSTADRYTHNLDPRTVPADMTYDQALKIAHEGGHWPQGAEHIQSVPLTIPSNLQVHALTTQQVQRDCVGARPCVPAYLANDPRAMFRMTHTPQPNKTIKIGVHVGRWMYMPTAYSYNRGTAILSLIDALHHANYATELVAIWHKKVPDAKRKRQVTVEIDVTIKRAHETWTPDSVAFAFASSAYQRCLIWSLINTAALQGKIPAQRIADDDLGMPSTDAHADYDIVFGYMRDPESWSTLDRAIKTATKTAVLALTPGTPAQGDMPTVSRGYAYK